MTGRSQRGVGAGDHDSRVVALGAAARRLDIDTSGCIVELQLSAAGVFE